MAAEQKPGRPARGSCSASGRRCRALCREYADLLERAGADARLRSTYGWSTLPSGTAFDQPHAPALLEGARDARTDRRTRAAQPVRPGGERRVRGVAERAGRSGGSADVVALPAIRSTWIAPICRSLPRPRRRRRPRFLDWLWQDGRRARVDPDGAAAAGAVAARRRPRASGARELTPGINIAGYFRAELGVGEAARLLTSRGRGRRDPALDDRPTTRRLSRQQHAFVERGDRGAPYDINVVCVNADSTAAVRPRRRAALLRGPVHGRLLVLGGRALSAERCTARSTTWTRSGRRRSSWLDGMRADRPATRCTPCRCRCRFRACSPDVTRGHAATARHVSVPVRVRFPQRPRAQEPARPDRGVHSRVPPQARGRCWCIKTINGALQPDRSRTGPRGRGAAGRDIRIVDGYVLGTSRRTRCSGSCDCYVSLHRSEGLGLTMAEAMALGKPVIATGYSGNRRLHDGRRTAISSTTRWAPCRAGCRSVSGQGSPWAEPRSRSRRRADAPGLRSARRGCAQKGASLHQDIVTKHDARAVAAVLHERLDAIRQRASHSVLASARIRATSLEPNRMATQGDNQVLASLDYAASLLTPTADAAPNRLFRAPFLAMQNVLFRILRPVLVAAAADPAASDRRAPSGLA